MENTDRVCSNCSYCRDGNCLVMIKKFNKNIDTCNAHATHDEMMAREEAIENYYMEKSNESIRNKFNRRKKLRLQYPHKIYMWFYETR